MATIQAKNKELTEYKNEQNSSCGAGWKCVTKGK
jgi:hypothetical protein